MEFLKNTFGIGGGGTPKLGAILATVALAAGGFATGGIGLALVGLLGGVLVAPSINRMSEAPAPTPTVTTPPANTPATPQQRPQPTAMQPGGGMPANLAGAPAPAAPPTAAPSSPPASASLTVPASIPLFAGTEDFQLERYGAAQYARTGAAQPWGNLSAQQRLTFISQRLTEDRARFETNRPIDWNVVGANLSNLQPQQMFAEATRLRNALPDTPANEARRTELAAVQTYARVTAAERRTLALLNGGTAQVADLGRQYRETNPDVMLTAATSFPSPETTRQLLNVNGNRQENQGNPLIRTSEVAV